EWLASTYASAMVEICRSMNLPLEMVNIIVKIAEDLLRNRSENPAVMAICAGTHSSIARMLRRYNDIRAFHYMEKSEQALSSISKEEVRNLAKIRVWIDKARFLSFSEINEAWHWAENAFSLIEKVRERIKDYASNIFVCDYFKPLGGNVEEKLNTQLDKNYRDVKCLLGEIYQDFDWLEDAEDAFKEALKYTIRIDDELASHSRIARIKVLSTFQFDNFEELYEKAKDYEIVLPPEHKAGIFVEYVLSCMISEKEAEEEEMKEAMEQIKTNLIAYALLLGTAHKIFGRFDRKEVLKSLERLEMELRGSSTGTLALILKKLIENERGRALEVAERAGYANIPLLSRLFAELAEGIRRDEEETNKALVKLFYFHV
ncbi:MAG: hypothetical protein KAT65_14050, partial [Methanophagales archaeon]|nr:hypothetical protein [Methanophagales archaeon]